MSARPVQLPSNDFERFILRASDKYTIMPNKKKEELMVKVLLIAALAGIVSLIVFPLAPIVAIAAGAVAFFCLADEYSAGEFIRDVINNPREYMNRSGNADFQNACARRVQEDGAFAVRSAGASIQSWWNGLFV